jgi:hypothetical protein
MSWGYAKGNEMNAIGQVRVAPEHEVHVVRGVSDNAALLERGVTAHVAVSCLVQPAPGDEVLVVAASGRLWITSVLTRESNTPVTLLAPGHMVIAPEGDLTLKSDSLHVQANTARFVLDEILHFGRSIVAHLSTAKIFAGVLETLAERVLLQSRHSYRLVEQLDHVRAGSMDHKADGVMHIAAENMFMTADNAVRVNASQIHMG